VLRSRLVLAIVAASVVLPSVAADGGAQVRVNGVRFELRTRVLAGEPEALARRLDGRWGALQATPSRSPARSILGRQRGPFHETLTLSPGPRRGTARLLVAVHDLRDPPRPSPAPPVPLPVASRVLNVVQFGEGEGAHVAFTIEAPLVPGTALQRLRVAAESRGWRRMPAPAVGNAGGAALWARRGARELTAVALPYGAGSRIVLLVAGGPSESRR
jgi:hypothetical protein